MRPRRLGAIGIFLPGILSAQALPQPATVSRTADSLARAFVAAGNSPSVAIAIVRGKDTITMNAWGVADLEQDVPATAGTVYRIGSITKQFTAAAVMQLVEQGKVRLEDSIAAYLPSLPAAWHQVTVRQLLNHTSGIPSYTGIGERWTRRWGEQMTPDTLVALVAKDTMWFAPGSKWSYDNSGYVVLGMLIEKVTGRSWADDLTERFLRPLGLTDTHVCLDQPVIQRRARGYEKRDSAWVNTQYLAMTQPYAAGAMCSSVKDLVRWNQALHNGRVVSPASYASMTSPEGAAVNAHYGFGLRVDTLGGKTIVSHGGGIHGFISANAWIPESQLSVTVLTNAGRAPADRLLQQLVRAALGLPPG